MKTISGHKVINLSYVPCNYAGNKVTFPVKGSIVLKEKPLRTKYMIWTEQGSVNVFGSDSFDLANFSIDIFS